MTISLAQLRRCSAAVDIGAARTRVYVKNQGLVVDEPTVAAINTRTGALLAVGAQAEVMDGRTPDYIRVVRPVAGGTVVDIDMAQRLLRTLVGDKLRKTWRRRPTMRAAVCLRTAVSRWPSGRRWRRSPGWARAGSSWSTPWWPLRSAPGSRWSSRRRP